VHILNLNTRSFETDELEKGTTLIIFALIMGGLIFFPVFLLLSQYEDFFVFRGMGSFTVTTIIVAVVMAYIIFSDLVLFVAYTFFDLVTFLAICKWLGCIRYVNVRQYKIHSLRHFRTKRLITLCLITTT